MDFNERKKLIKKTFDSVADGYDCDALRFFPASAQHLSRILAAEKGEQILDVATGTGTVALAIAQHQPGAMVTGVDFSETMLAQAQQKAQSAGVGNIEFIIKELPQLDLPANHFDAASCGFGIFFLDDMVEGMQQIGDKLKPGGRLVISSFFNPSFSPLADLFVERIERYGIEPPKLMWKRIATEEAVATLYQDAGFTAIQTHKEDVSYFLQDTQQWWSFLWNAGFRGLLNQLPENDLQRFRKEHLTEIESHVTGQGLFLRVETLYGVGSRPALQA